jgi:transcriptional regulator with XRE-family HTH domain
MMTASNAQLTLKDFGDALRGRRLKLAISIAKQAKELNVSAEDYMEYEAGTLVPPALTLKKLFSWQPFLQMYKPVLIEGRREPLPAPTMPEKKPAPAPVMAAQKVAPQKLVEVKPSTPIVIVSPAPAPAPVAAAAPATHTVWPIKADVPKHFGDALKWLRKRAGLRTEDLATLVGVDKSSVSGWESERTSPISTHYHELVKLFPELAQADVPACRHIDKPGTKPDPKLAEVPAPTKSEPLIQVQKEEVTVPEPAKLEDQKRHMVNWSKTLVAYHNSPEKVQQSVKSLLTSAHGMGFTIPELLEMLSEDA